MYRDSRPMICCASVSPFIQGSKLLEHPPHVSHVSLNFVSGRRCDSVHKFVSELSAGMV